MTDNSLENEKRPARRWLWIGLSLFLFAAVFVLLFDTEDTIDVQTKETSTPPPLISVLTISEESTQAQISAFAEVRPRWDAELRSAVSGRIITVHEAALAGAKVKRGDLLFSIDKTPYESAVATAEMELEQAKLSFLRAQNNVTVARRQFDRDGVSPPTDLALHLPQLRIAEKAVAAAEARMKSVRHELSNADVVAPFSGFVTQRFASLGQTVNQGSPLVHLSDNSQFELVAEFSPADWELLEHPISGAIAELINRSGAVVGHAQVRRGGGFLDQSTRQVRVFLDVVSPDNQILAGDFLRVRISGRKIEGTLTLPENSLTRAGHVWLVVEGDHLQRISPQILFRSEGTITIVAPKTPGPWRVAKMPLASFLPGQQVTPQVDES